jgi:hypothetical protein
MFSTPLKLSLKPSGVSLQNKTPLSLPTSQRRFKITAMAPPKPGGGKAKKGTKLIHSSINFDFVCFVVAM